MQINFAFILILGLSSAGLQAKDIDGEFVVFSAGANNCADYLSARADGQPATELYWQWLSGYLSAFNLIIVNTYDIIGDRDYIEIINWLDRYCFQNQQDSFANASATLTLTLYPERYELAPPKSNHHQWPENSKPDSAENYGIDRTF